MKIQITISMETSEVNEHNSYQNNIDNMNEIIKRLEKAIREEGLKLKTTSWEYI